MLSHPDFSKQLNSCEITTNVTNKRLYNIVNDYSAITRELCNAYKIICDTKARAILEGKDLEELNANKDSIRIGVLREAGFSNIFQLRNMNTAALQSIKGVGEESAKKIAENVQRIYDKAVAEAGFRLDYDHRNPAIDEFVRLMYFGIHGKQIYDEVLPFVTTSHERNTKTLRILKENTTLFKWMVYNREKREYYEQYLSNFINYINNDYLPKCNQYNNDYSVVRNATLEQCWQDFLGNSVQYYGFLESLVGVRKIFYEDANMSAMPSDLIQAIEETSLDLEYLNANLRNYQDFGTKYLVHQKRVLLGDEMGLGKTMQAIAMICHLVKQGKKRFLVVCPLSVLVNWVREIDKFTKLDVIEVYGDNCDEEFEQWNTTNCIGVTTYETLKKHNFIERGPLDLLIVDEAHYVKNKEAIRSKNVYTLTNASEYVLYMTGTPMENNIDEMKSLLGAINEEYTEKLQDYDHMSSAREFKVAIAPIYLRRVREDVLKELPELIEKEDWLIMNKREEEAYRESLQEDNFMTVRRLSWNLPDVKDSSKANRLLEICEEAEKDQRKVLVFSYFRDTLSTISSLLGNKCVGVITGDIPASERQKMVDKLSASENGSALVAQIEAGGVGLNIQAASIVIFCEPQFKPSIENQAVSRSYRMGQARSVVLHRLLMCQTVDEGILRILKEKQLLFDRFADESVIGAEEMRLNETEALKNLVEQEKERLGIRKEEDKTVEKEDENPETTSEMASETTSEEAADTVSKQAEDDDELTEKSDDKPKQ